jgi:ATP-binding cassette subfamily F protein uup
MAPPLLALRGAAITFGGRPTFEGLDLALAKGDRLALVGRNGSGKSTLLKLAAGLIEPDAGERFVQPGARVAYLPQEPSLAGFAAALDYVAADGAPRHEAERLLDALKLDGGRDPSALSGGEARRVALARALAGAPDALLLDEPTNHLDLPTIEWLEEELAGSSAGLVVVSHDRAFLGRLTSATLWLERGRLLRREVGFRGFETWQEEVLAQEEAEAHRLDRRIAQETEWLRRGVTARRRRNQGRLRRLHDLRRARSERIARTGLAKLEAESGPLSGQLVVEAEGIGKRYGERLVLGGFSTRILRGDRIGLIGPNGAGKTTLLRMLAGELPPDEGRLRLGTNLAIVHLDQQRSALDPERTLWDTLTDGSGDQVMVRGRPRHVVGYLRDFLFEERQARSPVASLSGGERNRLLLAKALARPANLLVLDEPTNDLDLETLDLLQEMLAEFDGTILLSSHDRDFLDRVVTSVIALEGDGRAQEYAGGYSDYLRQRGPTAASQPVRAKPAEKAAPPPRRATRLSYKEQRALDELPGRIAALEEEIAALGRSLADPQLYARDAARFGAAAARLQEARNELAQAEEDWLAVELKREELERTKG